MTSQKLNPQRDSDKETIPWATSLRATYGTRVLTELFSVIFCNSMTSVAQNVEENSRNVPWNNKRYGVWRRAVKYDGLLMCEGCLQTHSLPPWQRKIPPQALEHPNLRYTDLAICTTLAVGKCWSWRRLLFWYNYLVGLSRPLPYSLGFVIWSGVLWWQCQFQAIARVWTKKACRE